MTTYAIISDIHGNANNFEKALKVSKDYGAEFHLILGDLLNHGPRNGVPEGYDPMRISSLINENNKTIIAVRGNCDSEVDRMLIEIPIDATSNILIVNNHKCFMTHGHKYKEQDTKKLGLEANDFFFYGHTHLPVLKRDEDGVIIFNPGSITFPKGKYENSMGILTGNKLMLVNLNGYLLEELVI